MNLLIDVGNTRAKMAVAQGHEVVEELPLTAADLRSLLSRHEVERVAASVVGPMPDFAQLLPQSLLATMHCLSAQSPLPIAIDYATPHTLGPDRLASVVGARVLYPQGSLLVVDAGSCITLDHLDAHSVYQGGAILPGIGMKFRSLHTFTAKLPLLENNCEEVALVGKSTEQSIRSGVVRGTAYELQGFVEAYRRHDPTLKVLLTGGDARQLAALMGGEVEVDGSLVWVGLAEVLSRLPADHE